MSERKHEPAHFIPDIEIPADFEAVHRLEHDPEADVKRKATTSQNEDVDWR